MGRGLIGKFMSGVSAVAVPAALANQAAEIEQRRMATLQGYQQQNMGIQQEYQRENTAANQSFTAGQNSLDREQRQQGLEMQQQGLDMQSKQFDIARQQAELAIKSGELGLVQAKRLEKQYNVLMDPEATEDQRMKASENILAFTGKLADQTDQTDSFSAFTAYSDPDQFGEQTRQSGVLNRRTGSVDWTSGSQQGAASEPQPGSSSSLPVGRVVDGYKFLGGDPNSESSWESVTDNNSQPGNSQSSAASTAKDADQQMYPPPQKLTGKEVDTIGFIPDGYTKMTSGNYVRQRESKDWDGEKFIKGGPEQVRRDAIMAIYARLNPKHKEKFDASAWDKAVQQAEQQLKNK